MDSIHFAVFGSQQVETADAIVLQESSSLAVWMDPSIPTICKSPLSEISKGGLSFDMVDLTWAQSVIWQNEIPDIALLTSAVSM